VLLKKMIVDLARVKDKSDDEARAILKNLVPDLMKLSNCPDYVINKGHYFGTNLLDTDKYALIDFLKSSEPGSAEARGIYGPRCENIQRTSV